MTRNQFKKLQKDGFLHLPYCAVKNTLPSSTDPTQDIPVKALQFAANGLPINCKCIPSYYSNLSIEQMTIVDRSNRDKFDVAGSLVVEQNKLNKHLNLKKNEI